MGRRLLCAACVAASGLLYAFTGSASALLLLGASLLLPVTALLLAALTANAVTAELRMPGSLRKGRPGSGTLLLRNSSRLPVMRLTLVLTVENTLTGQRQLIPVECGVGPRELRELPLEFESAHCGHFVFACDELAVCDPFGLRGVARPIELRSTCLVLPDTFGLRVHLSGSEDPLLGTDTFSIARLGHDRSEPFQLREYAEGDDIRQIHWKLSQKLDRFIVADPSREIGRALLVVWDSAPASVPGNSTPEIPDALAEALISFCMALASDEIPYGLAWRRRDNGEVSVVDINTMDDLHDALPGLLQGSGETDRHSLVADLVPSLNGRRFPLLAYFSASSPRDLSELRRIGRATAFLCAREGEGLDEGETASWRFSPGNYRSVLRDVTV